MLRCIETQLQDINVIFSAAIKFVLLINLTLIIYLSQVCNQDLATIHFGFDTEQTCADPSISPESNITLAGIVSNSVYTHCITVAIIQILPTLINVYRT